MELYYFFYFLAGALSDFLWTLNVRFIDHDKALPSGITGFLAMICMMVVFSDIIGKLESQSALLGIIIYSLGIGVGSFLGVKFKLQYKEKDLMSRN